METDLQIRLLGELEIRRDERLVPLPQSRKTRALLAYLVLKVAPQRREALCEVLWELPDDPRAALRWSLSKLRPLVNGEAQERLTADRERAGFRTDGAWIDVHEVQRACSDGLDDLDAAALRALLAHFRGPLLAGLEMPAQPLFEAWRLSQQEAARKLHLHVLDALIARLSGAPEERAQRLRERVALDPGDEDAHNELLIALRAAGADAARQLELSRRMLAEFGPYDEARLARSALAAAGVKAAPRAPAPIELPTSLRQDIRFCAAPDGVRIAYATVGAGAPLLKTANWLNHLEFDWESPVWRHLFRALAAENTLVRYDSRGNGLSDWDAADLSLDALVGDLKAVADAAGLERFPLFALSQGCAAAVSFAARWPERVSRLVLCGGYARGWRKRGDAEFEAKSRAMIELTRIGWGHDNPAFRQMFTSSFIPGATPEQVEWFNQLQSITTSPANAAALMSALGDIDVSPLLGRVAAPTLVIHARGDARVPLENGRDLAAGIPGARLVTLESQNHLTLAHEPAWPRFLAELRAFLAADAG